MKLKAIVEACLVLEEGVCTVRDIDLGMMAGAGMDPRRGIFPPFMGADMLGLDVVLEKLEAAQSRARRALRAADGSAAPGRPGPPRPEDRPRLLRLPAARRGRPDRHGQARDSRRRRNRLAGQPADERDLPAGDQGPRCGLGEGQVRWRDRRGRDRVVEPGRLLGRCRHQGVHADGRGRWGGADPLRSRAPARHGPEPGLDDRGGQLARLRRRLRAGDGVRFPDRGRVGRLRPARGQARDHSRLRWHPAPAAAGRSRARRSR